MLAVVNKIATRADFQAILILLMFFIVPSIYWLNSGLNILSYMQDSVPKGQFYYVLSKLFGLYGLMALCLQIILGILGGPLLRRWHLAIGGLLVIFTLMHLSLFMLAVGMRSGGLKLATIFPGFTSGFYHLAISLGSVAFLLLIVVAATGLGRRRYPSFFKGLHRLSFIAAILALLHSFFIGTETRYLGMLCVYVFSVGSIVIALIRKKRLAANLHLNTH
jgi:DMSO/TMAO reductase YedYZ heme-binding membrane subunit